MTDWFQLERCYVTPTHCSHKIIKVLIITKLPQKITCLCNITRNAKLGKSHENILPKNIYLCHLSDKYINVPGKYFSPFQYNWVEKKRFQNMAEYL